MIQSFDKPVMVVSHERSGTHFLMNTLAAEFGYSANPHLALDYPVVNLNYFHPPSLEKFFNKYRGRNTNYLRKSHHQFDFFAPVIEPILKDVDIFYIVRDPRDVAHSFRHFLNEWSWFEGPKVDNSADFIRAAPAGQMLRYQYHQLPNMLQRWQAHVRGWFEGARNNPTITVLRYEDLDAGYDPVVDKIAKRKGWNRQRGPRPVVDRQTILASRRDSESNRYTTSDLAFFRQEIGATMNALGYDI